MLRMSLRLVTVMGIGLAAAACQNDNYGAPSGAYQPAPAYYNNGYNNQPPAPRYGYGQPAPTYYTPNQQGYYPNQQGYNSNQQGSRGVYNQADGRRYTTVTVTNRGQNGYRDDVVQQQVVCGSQYYDGYRNRTAPRC